MLSKIKRGFQAVSRLIGGMRKKASRRVDIDPFRPLALARDQGIETLRASLEKSRRELETLEPWADRAFYLRFTISRMERALSDVSR